MTETLIQGIIDALGGSVGKEAIVFIISMIPILELRGARLVAGDDGSTHKRDRQHYSRALHPYADHAGVPVDEGDEAFPPYGGEIREQGHE